MLVDARTLKKEDVQKETVYCLNDDDETEIQKDDAIQGMFFVLWAQIFPCVFKVVLYFHWKYLSTCIVTTLQIFSSVCFRHTDKPWVVNCCRN